MNVPRSAPDFRLTNFSLWVHDWGAPPGRERWDDNWLSVTAYHESTFGSFVTGGAIVQSGTIEHALSEFERLSSLLEGTARFASVEDGFDIRLDGQKMGQILLTIIMTSTNVNLDGLWPEKHVYNYRINQSYLPEAISGLRRIQQRFPRY